MEVHNTAMPPDVERFIATRKMCKKFSDWVLRYAYKMDTLSETSLHYQWQSNLEINSIYMHAQYCKLVKMH